MKKQLKKSVSVFLSIVLLCGSFFTVPQVFAEDEGSSAVPQNLLVNGSFENPKYTGSSGWSRVAKNASLYGWDTTDYNGKSSNMEYGYKNSTYNLVNGAVNAAIPDGKQFAEISCDSDSSIFQIVGTSSSTAYEWGVSHHGRSTTPDTLMLSMFDATKLSISKDSDLIKLRQWILNSAPADTFAVPTNGEAREYSVYTDAALSDFSLTATTDLTVKITFWFISSNNTKWYNYGTNSTNYNVNNSPKVNGVPATDLSSVMYEAEYVTAADETSTCIALTTFITASLNKDGTKNYAAGNVVDDVHIELKDTRRVTETNSQIYNTYNINVTDNNLTHAVVSTGTDSVAEWGITVDGTAGSQIAMVVVCSEGDEAVLCSDENIAALKSWMADAGVETPVAGEINPGYADSDNDGENDDYRIYTDGHGSFSFTKDSVHQYKMSVWLMHTDDRSYHFGTDSNAYSTDTDHYYLNYVTLYYKDRGEVSTVVNLFDYGTDGIPQVLGMQLTPRGDSVLSDVEADVNATNINRNNTITATTENSTYEWGLTLAGRKTATQTIMLVMSDKELDAVIQSPASIAALESWMQSIGTQVPYKGKVGEGFTDTDGDGYGDDYRVYTDGNGHFSLTKDEAHPYKLAVWLMSVDNNTYNFGTNSSEYHTELDHFYIDYNTFYYTDEGETLTSMKLYEYGNSEIPPVLSVQLALEGVGQPADIEGAIDATNTNQMYYDYDEDGNRLPSDTVLRNGSFEIISFTYAEELHAKQPSLFNRFFPRYLQVDESVIPYWETTAFQGQIEYFNIQSNSGNVPQSSSNKANHYYTNAYMKEGLNAAELNADEDSSLYQVIRTPSDSIYKWGLSHRARNEIGADKMALFIGPNQVNEPSKNQKQNGKDQFMLMGEYIQREDIAAQIEAIRNLPESVTDAGGKELTNYCSDRICVYSKPFGPNGTFLNDSDNNPFSLVKDAEHTERWYIYIIQSNNLGWYDYGDNYNENSFAYGTSTYTNTDDFTYEVPTDSEETLFAFSALSIGKHYNGTEDITYGNLLDDINFTVYMPQKLTTTTGGKGTQTELSNGAKDVSTQVVATNMPVEYNGNEYGGQTQTLMLYKTHYVVEAYEDLSTSGVTNTTGGTFLGAYVVAGRGQKRTRRFISADYFTKLENQPDINPDGTENTGHTVTKYSFEFTATTPTKVHLIFVTAPAIHYDANGGLVYECITSDDDENDDTTIDGGIYEFNEHLKPSGAYDPYATGTINSSEDYTSHAAVGQNDNWMFTGWLVASSASDSHTVLGSVHTASYTYEQNRSGADYDSDGQNDYIQHHRKISFYDTTTYDNTLYVTESTNTDANGLYGTKEPSETLIAMWRWRQNYGTKLEVTNADGTVSYVPSTVGGHIVSVVGTDMDETNPVTSTADYFDTFAVDGNENGLSYFAEADEKVTGSAVANENYEFIGWQDEDGNFIDYKSIYSFYVEERTTSTFYAVFRPSTGKTSFSVTKQWVDSDDQDGMRANYGITLFADGVKVGNEVILTNEQTSYSWVNLPAENADGTAIVYTCTETTVPKGYTVSYSSETDDNAQTVYVITNTHITETRDITVSKIWSDDNNHDGLRAVYGVTLYADSTPVGTEITLNADETQYTWTGLDIYRNGKKINYTVVETTVPEGYTSTVSGFTIVNTHKPDTAEGAPDTVVIDFGLPVDIHVLANDTAVPAGPSTITALASELGSATKLDTQLYGESRLDSSCSTSLVLAHGTAAVVGDAVRYSLTDMNVDSETVFYCEIKTANNYYYYTAVTVIPATTIYYEDNFLTYINGIDKSTSEVIVWETVGDTSVLASAIQDEDRPGAGVSDYDADNNYGYDSAYDDAGMTTYSMGSAKVATVRDGSYDKNNEIKAQFTFTGTGFDVISLTSANTGACVVMVTDTAGTIVSKKVVNTYYGYSFGRLYSDASGKATFDSEGATLYSSGTDGKVQLTPTYYDIDGVVTDEVRYYATGSTPSHSIYSADVYYLTVDGGYSLTPTYYDENGNIVEEYDAAEGTEPVYAYAYAYAYAYGWLSDSTADSAVYQVPIMKINDLSYGTYTVTIAPRYSKTNDVNNTGYYSVYIDAIRVYNPCGVCEEIENTVIEEAYDADGESFVHFCKIKQNVLDASSLFGNEIEDTSYAMFIDGFSVLNRNSSASAQSVMDIYKEAGPNNELYLANGQAIAFNLTISSATRLASVQLGAKLVKEGNDGSLGTLLISDSSDPSKAKEITVSGTTDLFRDITSCFDFEEVYDAKTGLYTYTGRHSVCIVNNSDTIISLTDIKWTNEGIITASAAELGSVENVVLSSDEEVHNFAVNTIENFVYVTPDFDGIGSISASWESENYCVGDTAILSIKTSGEVNKIQLGDLTLTDFVTDEEGNRIFNVSLVVTQAEESSCEVVITDFYGREITLEVTIPASDVPPVEGAASGTDTYRNFIAKLFNQIFELIKTLFKF